MRRVAVAGVVGLISFLVGWPPASAQESAATITEVGWWTSNQAATAPQGGVAVSAGPAGTITLAALRVSVNVDSLDSAGLSLKEAGGIQQSGAQLQVCTTPNAWTAGPKQALDKAPKPECDRAKAPLSRQADGTWTADVRLLLSDAAASAKSVSLMVVPAGLGSVPVGFEVQFAPPSLTATGKSSSGTSSSSGSFTAPNEFDSPPPASAGESSPSTGTSSAASSSSFSAGSSDSRSSVPSSSLAVPPTASSFTSLSGAASAPAGDVTAAAAAVEVPVAAASLVRPTSTTSLPAGRGSRGAQAMFFVLVAAVVAVGVGLGHARFAPTTSTS